MPRSRYVVFFSIALLGAALDLWSKEAIFQWRGMPAAGNEWWIIDGFFGIETALNRGALFGMGQGKVGLFAGFSVVAGVGILWWLFIAGAAEDFWLTTALGSISAGILGNLYDRLGLWEVPGYPEESIHAVRDWILFEFGSYTWPNFNIADCCLVCGAVFLFLQSFRRQDDEKEQDKE